MERYPTILLWPERKWRKRHKPKNHRRKIRLVNTLSNSSRKTTMKNHRRKISKNIQTVVNGTKHTVTTDTGKIIHRKFISDPIVFQKER